LIGSIPIVKSLEQSLIQFSFYDEPPFLTIVKFESTIGCALLSIGILSTICQLTYIVMPEEM